MSFREYFLSQLQAKRTVRAPKEIHPAKLQAFTRKEIETGIQLYQHLKTMGNTFDDLIVFIETERRNDQTARVQSAVRSAIFLTREEKRHMKSRTSGKRRIP